MSFVISIIAIGIYALVFSVKGLIPIWMITSFLRVMAAEASIAQPGCEIHPLPKKKRSLTHDRSGFLALWQVLEHIAASHIRANSGVVQAEEAVVQLAPVPHSPAAILLGLVAEEGLPGHVLGRHAAKG